MIQEISNIHQQNEMIWHYLTFGIGGVNSLFLLRIMYKAGAVMEQHKLLWNWYTKYSERRNAERNLNGS